jgi:hypothetical protein
MLLLLLSVFLLPDARAQAPVMRPPATPPVVTPNYFPGSTGNPVHTPAGAGASHGGLAEHGKAAVPRSPNKRILPPTKEAGLWAADGAPVASNAPGTMLFGLIAPFPQDKPSVETLKWLHTCAGAMDEAAKDSGRGPPPSCASECTRRLTTDAPETT